MQELTFRGWRLAYDAQATADAYARARPVGPEACGCLHCRNFIAARDRAYTPALREVATTVGIEPLTETEIWENGAVDPSRPNERLYGGFFHFVGHIVSDAGAPAEDIVFLTQRHLLPEAFGDQPVVQVDFQLDVPWVLSEPPESPSE